MKIINILLLSSLLMFSSCDVLQQVASEVLSEASSTQVISAQEASSGLKQALNYGTEFAVNQLSAENGFYGNDLLRIPLPDELQVVAQSLEMIGLSSVTDAFVKELNKGAEKAVKKAIPIFKSAITGMSFSDAMGILLGEKNAATTYFENLTRNSLYNEFKPEVSKVLDTYGVSKAYADMMNRYNAIPFVKTVNTDLPDYVTQKALDGLFSKVTEEEKKIRTDVSERKTQLLQKVFAYADLH